MSVFNGQRYLLAAVESILRQTWKSLELVAMDDGSTDDSFPILARLAATDSRVRIHRLENGGLTRALQAGVRAARGSLIARMDADDVAEPTRLEEQHAAFRRDTSLVALGSAVTLIDPDGEPLDVRCYPLTHDEIDRRLMSGDGAIPHPTAMFRRDAWERCGGYREKFPYAQDLDLWLRMAEIGRLQNLPQPLLQYRLHEQAISTVCRTQQLRCAREAVSDARLRRGWSGTDAEVRFPVEDRRAGKVLRGWSRMALRAGHLATARKHALAALRQAPWSPSNLGLAARILLRSARAG